MPPESVSEYVILRIYFDQPRVTIKEAFGLRDGRLRHARSALSSEGRCRANAP